MNERLFESELPGDGVMVELFASIGFEVADEDSYNLLAEYAENSGERSRVHRGDVTLHGRCWKLSEGLEVWSILYERAAEIYYADCRPAFRSRYVHHVQPWELIEYDEDGEAIVRGLLPGGTEVIFELQNLTELNPCVFREGHLHIALAGLAYSAQVQAVGEGEFTSTRFELAERLPGLAEEACENDYFIRGRVLAWRDMQNPVTQSDLVWLYVDCGKIRLEVLANRRTMRGRPKIGATIAASVWLQGHVLEATEIEARYEGVDRDFEPSDFWARLRRDN